MTDFTALGLAAPLLRALETEGYTTPTPIQAQAIPVVMAGGDLLGIAQTGTGKTAAFALPILDRLSRAPGTAPQRGCRVLVLAPTRELAAQIGESFRTYGRYLGLKVAVVFGGVSHRPQITALARGVDVLVATPGRLLDHMAERAVSLGDTEILVLDEADQMLDLGFLPAIRRLVRALPAARQNLFFSATMPPDIARLAGELLTDPKRVAVTPVGTTADRVVQRIVHVEQRRKSALLAEVLADPAMTRTLVFTRTKRGADRVTHHLEAVGIAAQAIHGNKSQGQRERALEAFRSGAVRVLVATDIAARGIDIDGVSHVVNYDLPEVPDAYVHRIGRTARAGAAGAAIAFCDPEERDLLRAIERLTRQTIPSEDRRNDTRLGSEGPARESGRSGRGGSEGRFQRRNGAPSGRQDDRDSRDARPANGRSGGGDGGRARSAEPARRDQPRRSSEPRDARSDRGTPRAIGDVAFLSGGSGGRDQAREPGRGSSRGGSGGGSGGSSGSGGQGERRRQGGPGRPADRRDGDNGGTRKRRADRDERAAR